jgi:hypothetical protein
MWWSLPIPVALVAFRPVHCFTLRLPPTTRNNPEICKMQNLSKLKNSIIEESRLLGLKSFLQVLLSKVPTDCCNNMNYISIMSGIHTEVEGSCKVKCARTQHTPIANRESVHKLRNVCYSKWLSSGNRPPAPPWLDSMIIMRNSSTRRFWWIHKQRHNTTQYSSTSSSLNRPPS